MQGRCAFFSTNLIWIPDKRQRYSDKYMKHIFFLVLTTLALLGCNAQEKAGKHTLFCYVRYDESAQTVISEASLQDEGNKTSIELPGGIRYQGREMELKPVYGMTYHYEYPAKFIPDHVFDWRDKKNIKNTATLHMDAITAFSLPAKSISASQAAEVHWEGTPLDKGETMVFMWENTKEGLTVPLEVASTSRMPVIIIPAAKMSSITPGDWTLYLVRKKLSKETVGEMPVNGILEYYTKPINVKVTK